MGEAVIRATGEKQRNEGVRRRGCRRIQCPDGPLVKSLRAACVCAGDGERSQWLESLAWRGEVLVLALVLAAGWAVGARTRVGGGELGVLW